MTPREILEQVKSRITADPVSYTQTSFCGTCCCIAGHIDIIVNGAEVHAARLNLDFNEAVMAIEACALDALEEKAPIWLFGTSRRPRYRGNVGADPEFWPADLADRYEEQKTPKWCAAVGCEAIDRYMAERGI